MKYKETHCQNALRIPTREEFHRFASNRLSLGDFDTSYSADGVQIAKISAALNWTYNNERWRSND